MHENYNKTVEFQWQKKKNRNDLVKLIRPEFHGYLRLTFPFLKIFTDGSILSRLTEESTGK